MNTSSIIAVVVALVVVVAGAWYFTSHPMTQPIVNTTGGTATQVPQATSTGDMAAAQSGAPLSATITYNGSSFSPANVTIAKGGTVTWVNQGSGSMWVASGVHPTHTLYDGTNEQAHCAAGYTGPAPFDQCGNGSNFTFTFDKTGSFQYHNHLNPSANGTVVVQ